MRWLRLISGIVWVFCWRVIYLEIFRWQHMTKSLRFNPPPPLPGTDTPPKAGAPLIAVCVGAVVAPLVFIAATAAEHGASGGPRRGRGAGPDVRVPGEYPGRVFTQPDDLPEAVLAGALHDGWGFTPVSLEYQAVGFGSHHWLATDARGGRLFATVDDLTARLRGPQDTADASFGRLGRAFATALSLRAEAGLAFVVAPVPGSGGQVLARLSGRYSLVVHSYIAGTPAGQDGEFARAGDRRAALDLLVQLHRAAAVRPRAEDFVVPHLHALGPMTGEPLEAWQDGPYARRAGQLLQAHAAGLGLLVSAYAGLARRVARRPDRMVITHGEPHAGNVMTTPGGLVLVDWDTVLLAPPERDLWDIAGDDQSLLDHYTRATGVQTDPEALTLYRLWFDLAEISEYLTLFRAPHGDTADTAEAWENLRHFLRPAERWPALCNPGRTAPEPEAGP